MYVMPLTGDRTPAPLANTRGGRFSLDGRLLAYNGLAQTGSSVATPDGERFVFALTVPPRK